MSKKMTLGKKFFCIIFFILIVWLVWKLFSTIVSKKKEGYFAALGKKEPFAALGEKKKESFAPLAKV